MFDTGDSVVFTFDECRRLRITVPEHYRPLAAWLHTDAQPNLPALDELVAVLQRCRAQEQTWLGNGCSIDFVNGSVLLESLYGRWPRAVVPESVFWPVIAGLRAFLADTAAEPGLARPAGYPAVTRRSWEALAPGTRPPFVIDHTFFPGDWPLERVRAAGGGAWASPECLRDPETGTWSGMWEGLELAGYYDPASGEALTYFPVVSP